MAKAVGTCNCVQRKAAGTCIGANRRHSAAQTARPVIHLDSNTTGGRHKAHVRHALLSHAGSLFTCMPVAAQEVIKRGPAGRQGAGCRWLAILQVEHNQLRAEGGSER